MHSRVFGIDAQRGPQVHFRLVEVLFFDADSAECHVRFVIIGIDAQLRVKLRARVRKLSFVQKDQAQIIMGFGLAGIEFQRSPKMPGGGGRLPQRAQYFSQPHVRWGVVRVRLEKIFVERGCLP